MFAKHRFDFIVPAIVVVIFSVLAALGWNGTGRIEQRVYDLFLHVKPALPENPSILLLDVNDLAISKVGVWPWSRDVMADGLILMREFGAGYAVFDIEYVNKSPRGLDTFILSQNVPDAFNQEFSQIQTNTDQLFEAIRSGSIPLKDAAQYFSDLRGETDQGKKRLLATVKSVERDNDVYLGQAARFFGSTFLTVRVHDTPEEDADADLQKYALDSLALDNVVGRSGSISAAVSVSPAILPVIQGARGAGFPNVIVDPDGVRRRIDLLYSYGGKYFAQLAFRPLLDWLGNPQVVLTRGAIQLKGANVPGKGKKDITIPLTSDGKFMINWSPKTYDDSFRHLSFYELVYHKQLEQDLLYNLKLMKQSGYLSDSYYAGKTPLLDLFASAESQKAAMLGGGDRAGMDAYVKTRQDFFASVGRFLGGDAEKNILADVDKVLASRSLTRDQRANAEAVKADVPGIFKETRGFYRGLMQRRDILAKNLPGAYCVIGITATSTTDIGVNPFVGRYVNVGTHASVVNTILQGRFLDQLPWWYGVLIALVFSFVVTLAILNMDALRSILVGGVFVVVLFGVLLGFFLLTGIYIDTFTPVASVFLTFAAMTATKFLRTEREKGFIRDAFGHYLSTDVINDLLENPEKLNLGGEKKYMTAMFTDVKGFSSISEVLDPKALVHLINLYLTEMCDIIMDLRGTIDKYEGDAIISFFGAPLDLSDHARRACMAAIRIKRAEVSLNEKFRAEKLSPSDLFTRIGINTGDMTVGNMGTVQRMDYTMMGSNVNLASRLEGVNKQYGTWIMLSEITQAECADDFTFRKLDRVRVVGINQPVRLYELIEEKGRTEKKVEEAVAVFHKGLAEFEAKDWDKAMKTFAEVLRLLPEDGPSRRYIKECQENKTKPPAASWDGVFNLTTK
jgi:adenylate cyclase